MQKRGGFTLVELIAVLTVLTILAAMLLWSTTVYIRKSRELSLISRARSAEIAAQCRLTMLYAQGAAEACEEWAPLERAGPDRAPSAISAAELLELAELPPESAAEIWMTYDAHGSITGFVWTELINGEAVSAVWNGTSWEVCRCWSP